MKQQSLEWKNFKLPHPLTILSRVGRSPAFTIKDIIIFQPTLQHLSFPATRMMTLGLIEKAVSTAKMINRRRCADIQQFDCIVRFFFIVYSIGNGINIWGWEFNPSCLQTGGDSSPAHKAASTPEVLCLISPFVNIHYIYHWKVQTEVMSKHYINGWRKGRNVRMDIELWHKGSMYDAIRTYTKIGINLYISVCKEVVLS